METEGEEDLPAEPDHEKNHNNLSTKSSIMRISTIPRSPEATKKKECKLVQSSSDQPDTLDCPGPGTSDTTSDQIKTESKVTLSGSIKTDNKEGSDLMKLTKKKLPCPDTIHEIEEDTGLTMDRVGKYLETNPSVVEAWLRDKASPELKMRLLNTNLLPKSASLNLRPTPDESPMVLPKRSNITTDLFQSWLASTSPKRSKSPSRLPLSLSGRREQLNQLDEGELFMELIRDIANELDINLLCHKILVNVGLLTYADRGSLFLAEGPPEERYLVAKLFDVTQVGMCRVANPFSPHLTERFQKIGGLVIAEVAKLFIKDTPVKFFYL